MLNIIQRKSSEFHHEETQKNLLVLHFTGGGSLSGMESALAIPDGVNIHYALDRDGRIYQYGDEKYWTYHTGSGLADAKRSIGIEVVCWGQLTRKGNDLFTWTGKNMPWNEAVRCGTFRGFEYFHTLSPNQVLVLPQLVADIRSRWEGMQVCTHAYLKKTKLDYPPDYPLICDLVTLSL